MHTHTYTHVHRCADNELTVCSSVCPLLLESEGEAALIGSILTEQHSTLRESLSYLLSLIPSLTFTQSAFFPPFFFSWHTSQIFHPHTYTCWISVQHGFRNTPMPCVHSSPAQHPLSAWKRVYVCMCVCVGGVIYRVLKSIFILIVRTRMTGDCSRLRNLSE